MKYKAYLEVRSQKPKGRSPRCGPDRYVAVQIVPQNQEKLTVLNTKVAAQRGIDIIYCGEGYSNRVTSKKSMLNMAKEKARSIVSQINRKGEYYGPRSISSWKGWRTSRSR